MAGSESGAGAGAGDRANKQEDRKHAAGGHCDDGSNGDGDGDGDRGKGRDVLGVAVGCHELVATNWV